MRNRRPALFRGRHFADEIIVRCVRWYEDGRFLAGGRNLRVHRRAVALPVSSGGLDGRTIDFYLSEKRDAAAAKLFLRRALAGHYHPGPRVINVDGNPSYPKVVKELREARELGRRCRCRTCPYLNNLIEQDHRAVKRRVNAKQGFRSFDGAWRTIQGYEAMHMIRKGQVRWLPKGDVAGQVLFINQTFGLKAA